MSFDEDGDNCWLKRENEEKEFIIIVRRNWLTTDRVISEDDWRDRVINEDDWRDQARGNVGLRQRL